MDAKGNLVALIQDFQMDVPAPESEAKGGVVGAAAKIYRIKIPQLELGFSYKVESAPPSPLQIHANVADFSPGTNAEVLAITDDETKAIPLSRFSAALVLGGLGGNCELSRSTSRSTSSRFRVFVSVDLSARPQRLGSGRA